MNETPVPATPETSERYKLLIIILTLITTVLTAIVVSLQADANIRANAANRDSQYYALLTSGEIYRSGLQSSYDLNTVASVISETQLSLMMQFTSMQSQQSGDKVGVAVNDINALGAQARADALRKFSIFYNDPRYAPKTKDGVPELEAYLVDSKAQAIELTQKQNTASDDYHKWSSKSDSYVGVLTVLAVAFFLLGLAQALSGPMRLVFAIFGVVILLVACGWTILILVA